MLLSIIIPVYNVAEYLQACIDSVLANNCTDCEIILVDDGATDGICPALCDKNAAQHPDLIRVIHQENQGLGGARNTGIAAALGEYLFFLDSDDTIAPNALSFLSAAIAQTHAEIYSFPLLACDGAGGQKLTPTSILVDSPFTLREQPAFLLALPAACARVWRTSLFQRAGILFPSRVWYEDIRTTPKLFALAESIVTLREPLYRYLQRPGSIMRSSNLARNREILDAFADLLSWFRAQQLFDTYRHALCRLAIDHVLLAASVRVARIDPKSALLSEFQQFMVQEFPDYRANPYCAELSGLHRLLLRLISARHYRAVRFLFRLKGN